MTRPFLLSLLLTFLIMGGCQTVEESSRDAAPEPEAAVVEEPAPVVQTDPQPAFRIGPQLLPDPEETIPPRDIEVAFLIDKDGSVVDPKVVGDPHSPHARAIMRVIRRWRFEPATVNGEPIRSPRVQAFHFPPIPPDPDPVFFPWGVDEQPVPVRTPTDELPVVPEEGASERWTVQFIVNQDGTTRDAYIVQPGSADPDLTGKIVTMIGNWQFEPAIIEGQQVDCVLRLNLTLPATP